MQKIEDVVRIPIDQIYPDPDQPRKRLPNDMALAMKEGLDSLALLKQLRRRAETQPSLALFLKGLDDLATSIKQIGQLAPIRVYPDAEKRYAIEMGERRWLAHLILYIERGEPDFSQIDAIIGPKRLAAIAEQQTLQRRMAENVHRAEFSPIEMARGLADRIAQVLEQDPETNRSRAEERVGEENGISARRVRQYLSLLGLCDEALALAQESGLTERALRGVLKHREPAAQVAAIRKLYQAQPEKAKSSRRDAKAKSFAIHEWAESFMQSVLLIGRNKKQIKAYERALRLRFKCNLRARALLNRLTQSVGLQQTNGQGNPGGKLTITSQPNLNGARARKNSRGRRKRKYLETTRPDERRRRGGKHRRGNV